MGFGWSLSNLGTKIDLCKNENGMDVAPLGVFKDDNVVDVKYSLEL